MDKFKSKPVFFEWKHLDDDVEFLIRLEDDRFQTVRENTVKPGVRKTKVSFPGDGIYRFAIKAKEPESHNESPFERTKFFKWGNVPDIPPPFDLKVSQE